MKNKELTGWHVLIMLVTFFGILIAVNIYFAVVAVKSFRGEDVKRSYRQGLEYNQTLSARELQKALGWTVKANIIENNASDPVLIVQFKENDDGLDGLKIEGVLRHPTDLGEDIPVSFIALGKGKYAADIAGIKGQWELRADATQAAIDGEKKFRFEHGFIIK